jgi:predicted nucleic acid-binding protein
MTGARRLVLLDNTVLTNLGLVGQDTLALRLWPDAACTTTDACGEYLTGSAAGVLPADAWRDLIQITLNEEENAFAARLTAQLGAGERSCLAVAISRSGALASDDLLARRWAREPGGGLAPHQGALAVDNKKRNPQAGSLRKAGRADQLPSYRAWTYVPFPRVSIAQPVLVSSD